MNSLACCLAMAVTQFVAAQQSFKSAVAQLLTDASGANTTAAGGFQVLPEDITILNVTNAVHATFRLIFGSLVRAQ